MLRAAQAPVAAAAPAPGRLVPEPALPELALPELPLPDLALADLTVPDLALADLTIPDLSVPDVILPGPPEPVPAGWPDLAATSPLYRLTVAARRWDPALSRPARQNGDH